MTERKPLHVPADALLTDGERLLKRQMGADNYAEFQQLTVITRHTAERARALLDTLNDLCQQRVDKYGPIYATQYNQDLFGIVESEFDAAVRAIEAANHWFNHC